MHAAAVRPSTSGWQLENDPRIGERVVRDQDGTSQRIQGELVRLRGQEEEERRGTGRKLCEALVCVELEVSTLVNKSRSDTKMVVSTVTTKVSLGLVTEFGF